MTTVSRDPRTGRPRTSLRFPDGLDGTLAGDELAALRAEYDRLLTQANAIRHERDDLRDNGQRRAQAADADALAASMRSGGKDPGDQHAKAAAAALADAERRLAGADRAFVMCVADITALLDSRREMYADDMERRVRAAHQTAMEAMSALSDAVQDLQTVRRVEAWLATGREAVVMPYVRDLTKGLAGDPWNLTAVLAATAKALRDWPA